MSDVASRDRIGPVAWLRELVRPARRPGAPEGAASAPAPSPPAGTPATTRPAGPPAWPSIPGSALRDVTNRPFRPKARRLATPPIPFVMTTEVCHLSCVMCHFNGPDAVRKTATLEPALVRRALSGRPPGDAIWFVATGDFLSDPNALVHLRTARELGLHPRIITHGQTLTPALILEKVDLTAPPSPGCQP